MKGKIFATLLTFYSCINMQLEKHDLQLIYVYGKTVIMYDCNLGKEVRITYNYDLFKLKLIELNVCVLRGMHPTFTFLCDIENLIYYQL